MEERKYLEEVYKKEQEDKLKELNMKANKRNQGMNEYQRFVNLKTEEKSRKFNNQGQNFQENLYLGMNKYTNNNNYDNSLVNKPNTQTENPKNINYNPNTINNYNMNINNNMTSPQIKDTPKNDVISYPENMDINSNYSNKLSPNEIPNNNDNKNNYEIPNKEEFQNVDLNDPNFNYEKYEEMMKKYYQEQLLKEQQLNEAGSKIENLKENASPPQKDSPFSPQNNEKSPVSQNSMNQINNNDPDNNKFPDQSPSQNQLNDDQYKQYYQLMQQYQNEQNRMNINQNNNQPNINMDNSKESSKNYTPQQKTPSNSNLNYEIESQKIINNSKPQSQYQQQNQNSQYQLINNYQNNYETYLKNKNNNQVSSITNSNYNFNKTPQLQSQQSTSNQMNNNFNENIFKENYNTQNLDNQNEISSAFRSKKYEQQMSYKNYLDFQLKQKLSNNENFKVGGDNRTINRKDKNVQINPYNTKKL